MSGKLKTKKLSIRYNGLQPGAGVEVRRDVDGRHAIVAAHGAYKEKRSQEAILRSIQIRISVTNLQKQRGLLLCPGAQVRLFFWAIEGRYGVYGMNKLLGILSAKNPIAYQSASLKRKPQIVVPGTTIIDYQLSVEDQARRISKDIQGFMYEYDDPVGSQIHDLVTPRASAKRVHLSDLWDVLEEHGLTYTAIQCLHCRVPLQKDNRPPVRLTILQIRTGGFDFSLVQQNCSN